MMVSEKQKGKPGIALVENGTIKVIGPSPGNEPAAIIPAAETIVKVNGNLITTCTEVTEDCIIEVVTRTEVTPPALNITVSRDHMQAYLEIKPETKLSYFLKNQPPTRNLLLEVEKVIEETNPYSKDGIVAVLKNKGIARIDEQAVSDALNNIGVKQIVARGILPLPSKNGQIDIKFSRDRDAKPVVKADGRVDFREGTGKVISVEPGDVIAEKIPEIPGKAGVNVYGETVEPGEPEKVFLQAGKGAKLNADGTIVTAVVAGQPEIQQSGNNYYISVQPNLVHKGNVNINSGNIRFKGNVHITGDVDEGMLVSGTGEVQIDGLVSNAGVVSGSNLTIGGNLLASKLEAGAALATIKELLPLLESLQDSINKLQSAARQASVKLQGKAPMGKVVALLLERKFPHTRNQVKKVLEVIEKNSSFPQEIEQLAVNLRQKLWGINVLQLKKIDDLGMLAKNIYTAKTLLQSLLEKRANVKMKYALNSLIQATGDVYISGQGCIDTTIKAGGAVCATGIFRGGSIEAWDNVIMNEVGSKIGTPTSIAVPEDKHIFLTRAFENVSLRVGGRQVTLNRMLQKKEVRLDAYGDIEFVYWVPTKGIAKDYSL